METLRIDRFQERTRVLGPGERSVVWFHGCSRNCPGCVAAEMNRSNDYETIEPIKLADRVCSVEGVEGLIAAGETTEQFIKDTKLRLQSSLSYAGARNWDEFRKRAKPYKRSNAGILAADVHLDVITKYH